MKNEIRKTGERMFLHTSIDGRLIELEESLGWIRLTDSRGAKDWLGCTKPVTLSFTSEDAELLAEGIRELCRAISLERSAPVFAKPEERGE